MGRHHPQLRGSPPDSGCHLAFDVAEGSIQTRGSASGVVRTPRLPTVICEFGAVSRTDYAFATRSWRHRRANRQAGRPAARVNQRPLRVLVLVWESRDSRHWNAEEGRERHDIGQQPSLQRPDGQAQNETASLALGIEQLAAHRRRTPPAVQIRVTQGEPRCVLSCGVVSREPTIEGGLAPRDDPPGGVHAQAAHGQESIHRRDVCRALDHYADGLHVNDPPGQLWLTLRPPQALIAAPQLRPPSAPTRRPTMLRRQRREVLPPSHPWSGSI